MTLRIATRGSDLARWQADHVGRLIRENCPAVTIELVTVETHGDRRRDLPISELGGKGVFAKEVQAALLDGRADIAVHSAKDLPSVAPPELVIASVPDRADPRDAIVGTPVSDLRQGAVVATGSLRRRAQLAHARPDLTFVDLRGNVPTRVARATEFDAIVLAAAGLDRLGLGGHATQRLSHDVMVPQVGQGALAIECRKDNDDVRTIVAGVEHGATRHCVDAERGFLGRLGGDCSLPAAAHARLAGDGLVIEGIIAGPDGRKLLRHEVFGPRTAAAAVGRSLATHLLENMGGSELLAPLR